MVILQEVSKLDFTFQFLTPAPGSRSPVPREHKRASFSGTLCLEIDAAQEVGHETGSSPTLLDVCRDEAFGAFDYRKYLRAARSEFVVPIKGRNSGGGTRSGARCRLPVLLTFALPQVC